MKAVVFTIDAIFALIITAAAITILLFFRYTPLTPYLTSYTKTQSLLNTLIAVDMKVLNGSEIGEQITYQNVASSAGWMQYKGGPSHGSQSQYGALAPSTAYIFTSWAPISLPPVAAYGDLFFVSGNSVSAINATSGYLVWNDSVGSAPNSIMVYDNEVLSFNSVNITAVSASNGRQLWYAKSKGVPIVQGVIYNGELIYSTADGAVKAFSLNNGTVAWSTGPLSFTANSLVVVNGTIAEWSSVNGITMFTNTGGMLWNYNSNAVTTDISALDDEIAFGNGVYACAIYINATQVFCNPESSAVMGVAAANSSFIYQTSNSVIEMSLSGSTLWSAQFSRYGYAVGYPVVSSRFVYSEWSSNTIVAQNISNGKVVWSTTLPYAIGNVILAYGRLYATTGSSIFAFGGCNGSPQASVLDTAVNLYVNGDGSCATALLDSLYPLSNSSVFLNGSFLQARRLPVFNGVNSVISSSNSSSLNDYISAVSYLAWFDPNSVAGTQGIVSQGTPSGAHAAIWLVGNELNCEVSPSPSQEAPITASVGNAVNANTWNEAGLVYNANTGAISCFINGVLGANSISTTISSFMNMNGITIGQYIGDFNGMITDVQIYNSILNSLQVASSYQENLQGAPVPGQSPVSWYPLDGETNDYSGFNNTGYGLNIQYKYIGYLPTTLQNSYQVSAASAILPVTSYAASLSSPGTWISVPWSTSLNINPKNTGITISVWFYMNNTEQYEDNNLAGLIGTSLGPLGSCGGYAIAFNSLPSTPNTIALTDGCDDGYSVAYIFKPQQWYNFVATLSPGSALTESYYVNGNLIGSGTSTFVSPTSWTNLYLGGQVLPLPAQEYSVFNGSVANIQLYNYSFSSKQVVSLYKEGLEGVPLGVSGLAAWWPLDGNANDYENWNNGNTNSINYTLVSNLYQVGVYTWK